MSFGRNKTENQPKENVSLHNFNQSLRDLWNVPVAKVSDPKVADETDMREERQSEGSSEGFSDVCGFCLCFNKEMTFLV